MCLVSSVKFRETTISRLVYCIYSLHKNRIKETVSSLARYSQVDADNVHSAVCTIYIFIRFVSHNDLITINTNTKEVLFRVRRVCIGAATGSCVCRFGAWSSLSSFVDGRICVFPLTRCTFHALESPVVPFIFAQRNI